MKNKQPKSIKDNSLLLPGNYSSIISLREIEPLLARAWHILSFYVDALDCSAVIYDRTGSCIKTSAFKHQMYFSEKAHLDALIKSRNADRTYIYTCKSGLVYWTSPLYRNGRYAGALTAGQVVLDNTGRSAEKDLPVRSHEKIMIMARLLGICAAEISSGSEDTDDFFRRKSKSKSDEKIPGMHIQVPEKERLLLAAFRRGDNDTGLEILNELVDNILKAGSDNFELVRFMAIELIVLLSRAAVVPGKTNGDSFLEANNRYLRRIHESKTINELKENLNLIAERIAVKIFSFQGISHASALRKADRYIWDNYTRKISLSEISRASGLSAPYFSTIFKEEMGENFSNYLNRLRVEKAAALLTETGKPLNEIAELCGFDDQSWFSKIFKSYTGISPGKFREKGGGLKEFKSGKKNPAHRITPAIPRQQKLPAII